MDRSFLFLFIVHMSFASWSSVLAQQTGSEIGRVVESSGGLWVVRQESRSRIREPNKVFPDDTIESGRRGTAVLADGPRWDWGVKRRTRTHLHWNPKGTLTLFRRGALYGNSNDGVTRTVLTEAAIVRPRGTSFYVEVGASGTTRVYVFDGSVEVTSRAGGTVVVLPERAAIVEIGNTPVLLQLAPAALVRNAFQLATATVALTDPDRSSPESRFSDLASRRATARQTLNVLASPVNGPGGQGKGGN